MIPLVPTAAGRMVPLHAPLPGDVSVRAIAHQLAAIALWHGATLVPYSAAQRAVLLSELFAGTREALHALLWPAPMAFTGVIEPGLRAWLERGLALPAGERLRAAEAGIRYAVRLAAGLGAIDPGGLFEIELAQAERTVIATELRDLGLPAGLAATLGPLPRPHRARIQPWPWARAEDRWLKRFRLLAELEGIDPDRSDRPHPSPFGPNGPSRRSPQGEGGPTIVENQP